MIDENFVLPIMAAGYRDISFSQLRNGDPYAPMRGWYGLIVDHPDAKLMKTGSPNMLVLSLNGIFVPEPQTPEHLELLLHKAVRYIGLFTGKEILYESLMGVEPTDSILNAFLNS